MTKQRLIRCESAKQRLEDQLVKGNKTTKEGVIKLSEKDVKRINKEISILGEKIASPSKFK